MGGHYSAHSKLWIKFGHSFINLYINQFLLSCSTISFLFEPLFIDMIEFVFYWFVSEFYAFKKINPIIKAAIHKHTFILKYFILTTLFPYFVGKITLFSLKVGFISKLVTVDYLSFRPLFSPNSISMELCYRSLIF